MLIHLSVKNYVLIKNLEIDFHRGFSVITGETGAGKSILLGALNIVLGRRIDGSVLMNGAAKCIVEAVFDITHLGLVPFFNMHDLDYEDKTVLRREITASGKSRAFINDTPVKLILLEEIREQLIDIHSQGENLQLASYDFQLRVIDSFAGLNESLVQYRKLFKQYNEAKSKLDVLKEKESKSRAEQDFLLFQLDELEKANLLAGEETQLEEELQLLNNTEEIKGTLFTALQEMGGEEQGILTKIRQIEGNFNKIYGYSKSLEDIYKRISSTSIELNDLITELEKAEEEIIHDQKRIEQVTERLDLINGLQNKHIVKSTDELLQRQQEIRNMIDSFTSLGEEIKTLTEQVDSLEKEVLENANQICSKRQKTYPDIEKEVVRSLKLLGMKNARFVIEDKKLSIPSKNGINAPVFRFSANLGREPDNIARVASGGEKSRLMLALKSLLSNQTDLPTIIFDEIDSGVSGPVADQVGQILRNLSKNMQVITISHLPQIAGKGEQHYKVFKTNDNQSTETQIKQLTKSERITEIAQLISGQKLTNESIQTARQLLEY